MLGDAVEGRVETADEGCEVAVEPTAAVVGFAGCCLAAALVFLLEDAVVVVLVVGCRAEAGRLEAAAAGAAAAAAGGRAEAEDGRVRVVLAGDADDDDLWEEGAFHTGALAAAGFAFFSSTTCGRLVWGLVATTALGASTAVERRSGEAGEPAAVVAATRAGLAGTEGTGVVACELARLDARERVFISAMVCACWMWMRPLPHPCSSCAGCAPFLCGKKVCGLWACRTALGVVEMELFCVCASAAWTSPSPFSTHARRVARSQAAYTVPPRLSPTTGDTPRPPHVR